MEEATPTPFLEQKKTQIALGVLLLVIIAVFVTFFSVSGKDDASEPEQEEEQALLPPSERPTDPDAESLEVRDAEEDLNERLDEAIEEVKEEVGGETEESEPVAEIERDGWLSYSNTLYDYAYEIPGDWYRGPETTATAWVAQHSSYEPAEATNVNDLPGARVEVLVQENVEGLTLEQLTEETRQLAETVHEESDVTLGAVPAKQLVADMPGRTFVVLAIRDLDIVTVTFTGNDVDTHRGSFDGIIQSFAL